MPTSTTITTFCGASSMTRFRIEPEAGLGQLHPISHKVAWCSAKGEPQCVMMLVWGSSLCIVHMAQSVWRPAKQLLIHQEAPMRLNSYMWGNSSLYHI